MAGWWSNLKALLVIVLLIGGTGVLVLYRLGEQRPEAVSIGKIHAEEGFPVEVTRPVRREFRDYLTCDGEVVEHVQSFLRAKVGEVVVAVHARVGEPVEEGQLLVEFRTEDLQADLQAAKAAYEEASERFERYENLREQEVVSEDRYQQVRTAMENAAAAVERAKSRLAFAEIHSPIDGVVQARMVEPGEFKGVGKELLSIVALDTLEVGALVPEQYVSELSRGGTGEFRPEGIEAWLEGTITRISPSTRDPNRFFDVYLRTDNRRSEGGWLLRPGMYVEVRFLRRTVPDALAVPAEAVVYRGQQRGVFVVEESTTRVEVAPPEKAGPGGAAFGERLLRGARRLFGWAQSEQRAPQQFREVTVRKALWVEVSPGLQADGFVELPGEPLTTEDPVILTPQEALDDGSILRPGKGD